MKNILKKMVLLVLGSSFILILLFTWILCTNVGTRTALYGMQPLLHYKINTAEIQGRLVDGIKINNLDLQCKKMNIKAETFELKVQFFTLVNSIYTVSYFKLLQAQINPDTDKIKNSDKILKISSLSVENFYFNPRNNLLKLTLLELQGSFQNQRLFGQGKFSFGEFEKTDTIHSDPREERLEFNWSHYKVHVLSTSTKLNLALSPTLIKNPYFSSQVSLELSLIQQGKQLCGEGRLTLKPGTLQVPLPGNKYYRSTHQGGNCQFSLTENNSTFTFQFSENLQNKIQGKIKILPFPFSSFSQFLYSKTLSGEVSGKFEDLSLCYRLLPALSRINGCLTFQANLNGSIASPKMQLQAEIPEGIFSIPKQHITFKKFNLKLTGNLPGRIEINNSAMLGGETYYLKGFFDLAIPNPQNEFTLNGENLRIYNTANINLYASPDLKLKVKEKQLYVEGILTIPEANIILKDEFKNLMTSQDVVYIDNPNSQTIMETFKINPSFKLIVKDKVYYKGNNLDARLEGKLRVERRQDKLLTALGRLTIVEGKYRLQNGLGYIHRGRLVYPPGTLLKDPVLDIRIARKRGSQMEDNTEVGMYVQGTLKKPLVHLYSNDNLQNTEIMSRLGFSATQMDGQDSQKHILSQTALFLAGGNPVFEKLEIDEFSLQNQNFFKNSSKSTLGLGTPNATPDSVLVVGKSFGKKFYLQYLQGMNEPTSGLRLKYFITPNLAIGVEKDTEGMGADLSFSMERN